MAAVAGSAVSAVSSLSSFREAVAKGSTTGHGVILFWADYHAASRPGGTLNQLIDALAAANPSIAFARCDSEAADDDILDECDVEVVPTTAFFAGGRLVSKVTGSDAKQVASEVEKLKSVAPSGASSAALSSSASPSKPTSVVAELSPALRTRLRALTTQARVVLFMKGTPDKPRCKFSRAMIELLASNGVNPPAFATFDILSDEQVRAGLKIFSGKPTFPQLYVEGKLLGGLDDTKALAAKGPLSEQLLKSPGALAAGGPPAAATPSTGDAMARCAALVKRSKVMLFMKGNPDAPRCGFSRTAVEMLRGASIDFDSFDILEDEAVRQGLKEFSKWPTYPQLYVKGKLIGGLDVLKEMAEEDEPLSEQLGIGPESPEDLKKRLASLVKRSKVMLFMKGNPDAPRCGFSRTAVEMLRGASIDFDSFDILEDEAVRQGLKEFSKWPTYPQLYVNGSLVGGLDVLKELEEDGELDEALQG